MKYCNVNLYVRRSLYAHAKQAKRIAKEKQKLETSGFVESEFTMKDVCMFFFLR